MKKSVFIILFALSALSSFAQKGDRVWCFGFRAGIDFNDLQTPIPFKSYSHNLSASACLSDSAGMLLLNITRDLSTFQRGLVIDRNGYTITNGDGVFFMDQASNGGMFTPLNDTTFYLFAVTVDSATEPYLSLYCNRIEKKQQGLVITQKNTQILDIPLEEKIAATKHADGHDWWVVSHKGQGLYINSGCNNTYYVFRVGKDGVEDTSVQQLGVQRCGQQGSYGEMTFTRSGKTLASTIRQRNMVELAEFDRCTGLLSNPRQIVDVGDSNVQVYGVEFSPDETKLYVLCGYDENVNFPHSELYQFDLSA